MNGSRSPWATLAAIAISTLLVLSLFDRGAWRQLFSSLRIAKPQPVTVNITGFSGPTATRRLADAVDAMMADTVSALDEKDQLVPDARVASQLAGFTVLLPRARKDQPAMIVIGAHQTALRVNRSQLLTIFREAGITSATLPASLDGAPVTMKIPRGVRAQYGHCPAPVENTLQAQLQGPAPPSTDNGDCIVLTENPPASADIPAGIDVQQLVAIGLQLSGMSPNQTQAFQKTFDSPSALSMSMPRFMRSYDSVTVNGTRGMLLNTPGRRGPTYDLLWTKNGIVFSLAGYGSSADAVPLATSMRE